jgi:hypothetical protein
MVRMDSGLDASVYAFLRVVSAALLKFVIDRGWCGAGVGISRGIWDEPPLHLKESVLFITFIVNLVLILK